MAFNVLTVATSIKNLIHKNNTTTSGYDVSNGLSERVQKVIVGYHENKPIPNHYYPCIWVEPKSKEEDFETSDISRRNISVNFDIVGICQYGEGRIDGREESDEEMMTLSTRVEKLFRSFPQLSITSVWWANCASTEWDTSESNDTYNSIFKIQLNVKIEDS